jgi:hypothetical protein
MDMHEVSCTRCGRSESCPEGYILPLWWIHAVVDDPPVCPDCATLEESRKEYDLCFRCGKVPPEIAHDGDSEETYNNAGWFTEWRGDEYVWICPECYVPTDSEESIRLVEEGVELSAREGKEYPYPEYVVRAKRAKAEIDALRKFEDDLLG